MADYIAFYGEDWTQHQHGMMAGVRRTGHTSDINLYLPSDNKPIFCICPSTIQILESIDRRIVVGGFGKRLLHWAFHQSVFQ